jgi:hypothetical protein
MEDEVFDDASPEKKLLLLIGTSHLSSIADHLNSKKWEIVNMCQRGYRITDATVAELTRLVQEEKKLQEYGDITAVIQLLDNSVFQVGGPGGTRHLPC